MRAKENRWFPFKPRKNSTGPVRQLVRFFADSMRTRTLDDSTEASNQGLVRITRRQYSRYFGPTPVHSALCLVSSFLPYANLRWHRAREHFKYGDTNPAIVLDSDAGLVAAYTDLDSRGFSRFHVIKIFRERLSLIPRQVRDGDRFAAVSLYAADRQSAELGRWSTFCPIVVDCVCHDRDVCEFTKAKIVPAHWRALTIGVAQIGSHAKPGQYAIELSDDLREQL
jgi:hypothetical protein